MYAHVKINICMLIKFEIKTSIPSLQFIIQINILKNNYVVLKNKKYHNKVLREISLECMVKL